MQPKELADVLKTPFCGRFSGAWDDAESGAVWGRLTKERVKKQIRQNRAPVTADILD